MSSGELCGSKVWVSEGGINSLAGHWRRCTKYAGHDGSHGAALYCVWNAVHGGQPGYSNQVIGSIQWDDAIADKMPR